MSRVNASHRTALTLVLVSTLWLGCGRTSLDAFQSETSSAGNGGVGGTGGTGGTRAVGGNFTSGGTFASGGGPMGGTFTEAGASMVAGQGGQSAPLCALSPSDCRTPAEPECALSNFSCEGTLNYRSVLSSLQHAHVVDVKTSRAGRVAVAGYYEGALRSDSDKDSTSSELLASSTAVDAFVASYDAFGVFEWAYGFGAQARQAATGIAFAPNGDLVVQVAWGDPPSTRGLVARFDERGVQRWQKDFGAAGVGFEPGQVAIDNDDETTLVGTYRDEINYETLELVRSGDHAYLLRLAADGTALSLRDFTPPGWLTTGARRLAVDDEDNVIIAGDGTRPANVQASFLAKLTPTGEVVFSKELSSTVAVRVGALTVDRSMHIAVGGELRGALKLDGTTLESAPDQASVWLAQYNRAGELAWSLLETDEDPSVLLFGASADPHGNLLLVGARATGLFVSKWRSGGTRIWRRDLGTTPTAELAIASDNDSNVWLAGSFQQSIDWGDYTTATRGTTDGFLTRLSP